MEIQNSLSQNFCNFKTVAPEFKSSVEPSDWFRWWNNSYQCGQISGLSRNNPTNCISSPCVTITISQRLSILYRNEVYLAHRLEDKSRVLGSAQLFQGLWLFCKVADGTVVCVRGKTT